MAEDLVAKYTLMVSRNPGNDLARFSLAKALFDAGRYPEAAESFRLCIERKPDWMFPTILLGRCQLQMGDRMGARNTLSKARELAIAQHHEGPLEELDNLLSSLQE